MEHIHFTQIQLNVQTNTYFFLAYNETIHVQQNSRRNEFFYFLSMNLPPQSAISAFESDRCLVIASSLFFCLCCSDLAICTNNKQAALEKINKAEIMISLANIHRGITVGKNQYTIVYYKLSRPIVAYLLLNCKMEINKLQFN